MLFNCSFLLLGETGDSKLWIYSDAKHRKYTETHIFNLGFGGIKKKQVISNDNSCVLILILFWFVVISILCLEMWLFHSYWQTMEIKFRSSLNTASRRNENKTILDFSSIYCIFNLMSCCVHARIVFFFFCLNEKTFSVLILNLENLRATNGREHTCSAIKRQKPIDKKLCKKQGDKLKRWSHKQANHRTIESLTSDDCEEK